MDGNWAEQPGALLLSDNEAENQLAFGAEDTSNRRIPRRVAAASRKPSKATLTKGVAGKNKSAGKNSSERMHNDNSEEDVVMINDTAHNEEDREQVLSKTSRASVKTAPPRANNRSSVIPSSARQATLNFSQPRTAVSTQRRQQPVCLSFSSVSMVTNG